MITKYHIYFHTYTESSVGASARGKQTIFKLLQQLQRLFGFQRITILLLPSYLRDFFPHSNKKIVQLMALIVFYNLGNYVEAKFKCCDNTDTYTHAIL